MANFSASNLVQAQTILNKKFASPEMRTKPSPALDLLLKNGSNIIANIADLRKRDDRPVTAYMIGRNKRTPGTARVYNHTGPSGDSVAVPINFFSDTDSFSISLKQLDNNIFGFNEMLANQFQQAMLNVLEGLETAAIAYLLAQRTQYAPPTLSGATFNATNDVYEVASGSKSVFYQILSSIARQNRYRSRLDVIASSPLAVLAEYSEAQGAGNANNLNFQFQGKNIAESIELNDSNYANGVVLAMPEGTVGAMDWIPKQNREGRGDYNSTLGGYGSMMDPYGMGLTFAVHGYAERADTSARNGGSQQDDLMQFEVSLDMSFNKAPLTGSNSESTIFEVAQI